MFQVQHMNLFQYHLLHCIRIVYQWRTMMVVTGFFFFFLIQHVKRTYIVFYDFDVVCFRRWIWFVLVP